MGLGTHQSGSPSFLQAPAGWAPAFGAPQMAGYGATLSALSASAKDRSPPPMRPLILSTHRACVPGPCREACYPARSMS
jgi:hypothetical protein